MFCITSVVSGKSYQEYIPYYIYSILKSYPDYYVKIFCKGKLRRNIKKTLTTLSSQLSDNFEIVDNVFPDYPDTKTNNKACRWLLQSDDLSEFDFVYIGDIDFIILPEDPPFIEQHKVHCETLGLPYSNIVRPYDALRKAIPMDQQDRLTGLHFISQKKYYEKMDSIIEEYKTLLKEPRKGSDEKILYQMGLKAFGSLPKIKFENIPNEMRWDEEFAIGGVPFWRPDNIVFRPYHGIHIGAFRKKNNKVKDSARINNFYYGKSFCDFIKIARTDPVYQKILKNTSFGVRKTILNMERYIYDNLNEQRKDNQGITHDVQGTSLV